MEVRLTLVQSETRPTKEESLDHIEELILSLKGTTDMVLLPEMCLTPYQNSAFVASAEPAEGPVNDRFAEIAKKAGVWLVAGTVAERGPNQEIYNTSYVFNPQGERIARCRKMHLFDIDIEGGVRFMESDTLTPGEEVVTFETPWGIMGLCVCFDIRFPELARQLALDGAQILFVPGAFNRSTGPLHWEVILRARAIDNQLWTAGCAPACQPETGYCSWGHSILCDPWGKIVEQFGEDERVEVFTVDLEEVQRARAQIPMISARRTDLYELVWKQ